MAVTLAEGSTVHNSSAVDGYICLFRHSASLDLLVRYHVLDHLSSYLVFSMNWLRTNNPVIDWIGFSLDLSVDGVSTTLFGTPAG